MRDEKAFGLLEETVHEVCLVRSLKTRLKPTTVMDRIDWARLGAAADTPTGMDSAFLKVMRGEIALAEMVASGMLPA